MQHVQDITHIVYQFAEGSGEYYPNVHFRFFKWNAFQWGRWPAQWQFTVTTGCGRGTVFYGNVTMKNQEMVCVRRTVPGVSVTPGGYSGGSQPASLTLQFDSGEIGSGTAIDTYLVAEDGTVVQEESTSLDGNCHATITAPSLSDGTDTLLIHYPNNDIDGSEVSITVGSYVGEMTPGHAVRGCSNYEEWSPVYQPSAAACLAYCADNSADACEYRDEPFAQCYVEFGNGCYIEDGYYSWNAAVLNP